MTSPKRDKLAAAAVAVSLLALPACGTQQVELATSSGSSPPSVSTETRQATPQETASAKDGLLGQIYELPGYGGSAVESEDGRITELTLWVTDQSSEDVTWIVDDTELPFAVEIIEVEFSWAQLRGLSRSLNGLQPDPSDAAAAGAMVDLAHEIYSEALAEYTTLGFAHRIQDNALVVSVEEPIVDPLRLRFDGLPDLIVEQIEITDTGE